MNRIGSRTSVRGLYLSSAWSSGGGFEPNLRAGLDVYRALTRDFDGES